MAHGKRLAGRSEACEPSFSDLQEETDNNALPQRWFSGLAREHAPSVLAALVFGEDFRASPSLLQGLALRVASAWTHTGCSRGVGGHSAGIILAAVSIPLCPITLAMSHLLN